MTQEFKPYKIGNRTLKLRNWKVKDRNKFKESIKNIFTFEERNKKAFQHLVLDCLEEPAALNMDERECLLIELRTKNLGEKVKYKNTCKFCNKKSETELDIKKLLKTESGELKDIEVNDIKIKIQDIINIDFYNKTMESSENTLTDDFILHIKAVNDNETLGYNELKKFFEEVDIETMDKILDEFEKMIFRITDREYEIKCPHCNEKTTFYFDDIPELIPQKWFTR